MDAVNTQADARLDTVVRLVDLKDDFETYEQFGPQLRSFLRDAPIDISSVEVEQVVQLFIAQGRRAAERCALDLYRGVIQSWSRANQGSLQVGAGGLDADADFGEPD